jgi:hypothetical protein
MPDDHQHRRGPRGVETRDGTTLFIEPGQTVDVDVAKDHKLYEGLAAKEAEDGGDTQKPLAARTSNQNPAPTVPWPGERPASHREAGRFH